MPTCRGGSRHCRQSPSITLDGDKDGVLPASDGRASASKFTGHRSHRVVRGAGHNLPQEVPKTFAAAIMELIRI